MARDEGDALVRCNHRITLRIKRNFACVNGFKTGTGGLPAIRHKPLILPVSPIGSPVALARPERRVDAARPRPNQETTRGIHAQEDYTRKPFCSFHCVPDGRPGFGPRRCKKSAGTRGCCKEGAGTARDQGILLAPWMSLLTLRSDPLGFRPGIEAEELGTLLRFDPQRSEKGRIR